MRAFSRVVPGLLVLSALLVACATATVTAPAAIPTAPAAVAPANVPTTATLPALRIAYLPGEQVMLWTEGQGARALGPADGAEEVRLSDDGQVVACLAHGGGDRLSAAFADGSPARTLMAAEALQAAGAGAIVEFGFAPGTHSLYVATDRYDLQRIDADSGETARLFPAGGGGLFTFSPDGQWMTLYHPNEVVLAQADGSGARTALTFPEDFSYTMTGPQIVWAEDSAGFTLAAATGTAPQGEAGAMAVWFVPVEGEPAQRWSFAGTYGAHLSPDGRAAVYLDQRPDPVEVHVASADGTDVLYNRFPAKVGVNLQFMGWAPDSEHFLLNLSDDGRVQEPYLAAVGEDPVPLADTPAAGEIRWVGADRVVYVGYGDPAGQALRLQVPGSPSEIVGETQSFSYDTAYVAVD